MPSAAKAFAKLPHEERQRIGEKIDALAVNPRPGDAKKLTGLKALRARIGDYRVVYEVRDRVLLVLALAIGNRRDIHKRLKGM